VREFGASNGYFLGVSIMSEEVAAAISDAFNTEYGTLIDAIVDSFQRGGESGDLDLVGVVDVLAFRVKQIAAAITPQDAEPGKDATGGTVASLTEAIMGVTGGLVKIADSIQALAEAVTQMPAQR
jgi:phage-related protein